MKDLNIKCTYCSRKAKLTRARDLPSPVIYNEGYLKKNDVYVWYCDKCEAFVVARRNTFEPLGRLAKKDLRRYRYKLHLRLDRIWKEGKLTRTQVYHRLANGMNKPIGKCHIGDFNMKECRKAESIIAEMEKYTRNYC